LGASVTATERRETRGSRAALLTRFFAYGAVEAAGRKRGTALERWSLEEAYDAYPRIEEEFEVALDETLSPRGPEMLFDLVADLGYEKGARVLDVGCGEGRHSIRLGEKFAFEVTGIDPVERHVELSTVALAERPDLSNIVEFRRGAAEAIPVSDSSVDLIWCVDVLGHIESVEVASAEFRRVLREHGRALVYSMMGTERLEPREAEWLWRTMGVVPTSAHPSLVEQGFEAGGLKVDQRIVIGTEWGERIEEQSRKASRKLIHAARLLRDPERYIERFGRSAYEIMLADCHWAVYGLIGKLSRHVWVLSRA
jgi:SAM-dependent methyltransferase